jgi:DNA-binding MarR family transcriptional regulator
MIGALLRAPWQALRERLHAALITAGFADLHVAHLTVFAHPGPEGLQPTDLARRAQMTKQAMNHLLGQLEGLGYIERRAHRLDGRATTVHLTARGRAAIACIRRNVAQLEDDWRERLGAATYDRLRRDLERLNRLVDDQLR